LALIRPFKALRPAADKAKQVSCVPYDVVYESEVRAFLATNPLSFLRVTRAEAEFPEGSNPSNDEIFSRARQNLDWFIGEGIYETDPQQAFYVYQLSTGGHSQTGVVGCCAIDDYDSGVIKKHENVRPEKVEDRTEHLLEVEAQTGLIFLAFRGTAAIHALIDRTIVGEPIYDFECTDRIRHRIWRVVETATWIESFAKVPSLYIADGHHRAESARNVRETLKAANPKHDGTERYNFVVAGMFPAEDLRILAYNRVVKDLNELDTDGFFKRLRDNFIVADTFDKEPKSHGEICMYIDGKWFKLRFNVNYIREPDPIERLDVTILQKHVLEPVLGIKDPTTDDRIGFVGGMRGTDELERLVNEGIARVAFSLYPTTIDDLLSVSDTGEVMPPKSTWFEPKLRDGLLVHEI
jgi:uncharacterized protein (DUF1015 family)